MAHLYDMNGALPATGAAAIIRLKSLLVSQGWTVTSSGSTGTGYSSSGDIIGTNAAIMVVNNAWFCIQDPNGHRAFCFQRGTTNLLWRMKYSANPTGITGFTGGAPSATQTPSATDEQTVFGGGTDAAPSFSGLLTADGTYKIWLLAGDSTVGYGWYFFATLVGTTTVQAFFYLDVLKPGSYPVADVDPCVVYTSAGSANSATSTNLGTYATGPQCWFAYGLSGATFTRVVAASYIDHGTFNESIPDNMNNNPADGNDTMIDFPYFRGTAAGGTGGVKGVGSLFKLQVQARPTGAPYKYLTAYDYGCFDIFLAPTNALMIL